MGLKIMVMPTANLMISNIGWHFVSLVAVLLLLVVLFISAPIWLAIFATTACPKERLLAVASMFTTSIATLVVTV